MDSKKEIKKNANFILNNQDRYYYVGVFGSKTGFLSSSNSKTEAKKIAMEKLKEKFNLNKMDKLNIYRITIRKVTKKEKQEDRESEAITLVGGVLLITIEEVNTSVSNDKLTFKIEDKELNNRNKIFVDNKYLKKYNYIDDKTLQSISFKFSKNKISGGFSINKISEYIK